MLSVLYKIASAAIANRLKPYLDSFIDNTQSGFFHGRYIYFDSISWDFVYKTLSFLGFKAGFVNWIKLFNHGIIASVLQCSFLSETIVIERECR